MKEWTGENWHDENPDDRVGLDVQVMREGESEWLDGRVTLESVHTEEGEFFYTMICINNAEYYPTTFARILLKNNNPTNGIHQPT